VLPIVRHGEPSALTTEGFFLYNLEELMKKVFLLAAIVLASSIPAHAQFGGTIGSTGGIGTVNFQTLPAVAPAIFKTTATSGSQADFMPSRFTLFSDGLAEGKALLEAKPKTVGEIAAEYRETPRPKAKVILTQDAYGYAVIETK
jgi:hypothetical protein